MWSGFQTFPQIFVAGTLIGGLADLKKLLAEDDNALSAQTAQSS
jgi:glutaredoxin-related protein